MSNSDPSIPGTRERPSSGVVSTKGARKRRTRRVRKEKEQTFWQKNGKAITSVVLLVGALVAAAAVYLLVIYPSGDGPKTGKQIELTFERDESPASITNKLGDAGLLRSASTFALYARLVSAHAAPGKHLLTDDASPGELVRRLERMGGAAKAKVTIPEGWTRFDIAKRLQKTDVATEAAFLEASSDPELLKELSLDGESAEGFLFPATYDIAKDSDPKDVVRRLVSEFEKRFSQIDQNHHLGRASLEGSLGWGRREIVTLASMVEKEAAVDDERPIIASVFLNRLRDPSFKRKVLQCDPTAGYGCLVLKDKVPACAGYAGKITHAINFDAANTYSTYVREGLPPGPIANPGAKSLQAVLAPASTKYLYFVARGQEHRHAFSETLDEHNTAVKDLKERTAPPKP